jgi:hypothetical protein
MDRRGEEWLYPEALPCSCSSPCINRSPEGEARAHSTAQHSTEISPPLADTAVEVAREDQ